jgi:hypothetical protein
MKKTIKRIGFALIVFWLLGVVYRMFFEKASSGALFTQVTYTTLDAVIDGSLIVGIILLIVGAFVGRREKSSQELAREGTSEAGAEEPQEN